MLTESKIDRLLNDFNPIIWELYQKYYYGEKPASALSDDVTSSHWKQYGGLTSMTFNKKANKWSVHGQGFGNFKPDTPFNRVRYLPIYVWSMKLIRSFGCDPKLIKEAELICWRTGRLFDFDCARQVLAVDHAFKSFHKQTGHTPRVVCVIGDGYGFMTSLVCRWAPGVSVVSINLGRILAIDALFCKESMPPMGKDSKLVFLASCNVARQLEGIGRLLFVEAEKYEFIFGARIDLFLAVSCFQEMDLKTVKNYFNVMRRSLAPKAFVYLVNRVSKVLPDGTISDMMDWPWDYMESGSVVNERCPWYQEYPQTRRFLWPLVKTVKFDGPINHTFAQIKQIGV